MAALGVCPICSTPTSEEAVHHRVADQQYSLVACTTCGLQHWHPLAAPNAAYYENEEQQMYSALHQGTRRADHDERFRRFLGEFRDRKGLRLLDVGCADGALIEAFRTLGNEVVGIDIDARSLTAARERGLEVYEATLEQFASTYGHGRRFDMVTMFDVLEHLTDPKRALQIVRSHLSPKGLLVGTVPNRDRLLANLVYADFPPHHFLRFDRTSIERTLRLAGFVPQHVEVFQWGYAGPVLLNAAVRAAKRMRNGSRSSRAVRGNDRGAERRPLDFHFKHAAASALSVTLARAVRPVERALGRGFKLYFVAQTDVL